MSISLLSFLEQKEKIIENKEDNHNNEGSDVDQTPSKIDEDPNEDNRESFKTQNSKIDLKRFSMTARGRAVMKEAIKECQGSDDDDSSHEENIDSNETDSDYLDEEEENAMKIKVDQTAESMKF